MFQCRSLECRGSGASRPETSAPFDVDEAETAALRSAPRLPRPMTDRGIAEGWLREHGEPLDLGGLATEM